jgi:hypothetical protein
MDLHINGKDVARAVHPSPWNATGIFRVGAHAATHAAAGGFFKGLVADVHAFHQVVIYDDGNPHIRDFDGDNKTDLIGAHTDGRLLLYRGNGAGYFRPGQPVIGSGWNSSNLILSPGDFTGDGHHDMISRKPDGTLWLFRGNGAGNWINAGSPNLIGSSGWQGYVFLFSPGDFDGDGKTDVVGVRTNGTMVLYRGNGAGGWIDPTSVVTIGSRGWENNSSVFSPGDFDGDGNADVLAARKADAATPGQLLLYRGNGRGGWLNGDNPTAVGSGWHNGTAMITPGDFDGDGHRDVIRRQANGDLLLYRGNGAGGWINGNAPPRIGIGWNGFTKIM